MKFCPPLRSPPSRLTLLLPVILALNACKSTPQKPNETDPSQDQAESTEIKKVADKAFDPDTLYALLVAEMAIDRQRYDIALGNYVQQATNTQDPIVAERATQLARGLNARKSALEMSQLWAKLDPSDNDANMVAINELIQANEFIEAFNLSKTQLEQGSKSTTAFDRIAVAAEHADADTARFLTQNYAALADQYPSTPDLWIGYSILLSQQERLEEALSVIQKAKALDKSGITSTFQECVILQKMGNQELAQKKLAELVKNHPDNIGLRSRYARMLWTVDPTEAERQFEILFAQSPTDPEILFSLALVKKEREDYHAAKSLFEQLLQSRHYPDAAYFNLGEVSEALGDPQQATAYYRNVKTGQNYGSAVVRLTEILISNEQPQEALEYIAQEKAAREGPQLETLYLIEADLHSKANRQKLAEKSLTEGINAFPQSTRLLYARAMLYAQIDYISAAERDLKHVLTLVPDNAAALNALGYTLADRTQRYDEAEEYIKRAFALTPNDPAVMDSMGWIAYRQGNLEEALIFLHRAMAALPDHEIAAHLGEVLWAIDKKDEAIAIWKKGLELKPESEIIHKTLHRLNASVE